MPYFVINGYPNCPNYMHAIYVAQYLSKHLPEFQYKKIELLDSDWTHHLLELNRENTWYESTSPLIWKEITMWGGKKYLIGGLSEFWEYVYCYYGLESRIPKSELEKLAASNLKFFQQSKEAEEQKVKRTRIIGILGATAEMTFPLINDILTVRALNRSEGILIRLYDDLLQNQTKRSFVEDMANYYNSIKIFGDRDVVEIRDTFEEFVKEIEILIHIEDFRQ